MFRDRDGWRVSWRVAGKKTSRMFASKRDAQMFELQLKSGQVPRVEAADITFAEFASRWLESYCKIEKAESQWVTDESAIRIHLLPALGETKLRSLTSKQLVDFRLEMRARRCLKSGRPLSTKTVNLVLSLLKKMLAVAVEWELLSKSPAAALKLFPLDEKPMDYWTAHERDHFLRFAKPEAPELVRLATVACFTGLRRSEIAGLRRSQIDFEHRMIRVDGIWCFRARRRLERTKNRKVGHVPMNDAVVEALAHCRLMAPESLVFRSEAFANLANRLRRVAKRVGVKPLRFHDLRHTFASCLVAGGVPLYSVQKLMRHKTLAMTQRYAHLAPGELRGAVDGLLARGAGSQSDGNVESVSEIRRIAGAAIRI